MNDNKKTGNFRCIHASIFNPSQPNAPITSSNWRPRLEYFKKALEGSFSFNGYAGNLVHPGFLWLGAKAAAGFGKLNVFHHAHFAASVEHGTGLYHQFAGDDIAMNHRRRF